MIAPFVSSDFLRRNRDRIVLCDVRWSPQVGVDRAGFSSGHIAGACFVDLDAMLAAPPSPAAGRHPLPEPAAFTAAMTALGIGSDQTVVAYDGSGGQIAARLVWMLRALGEQAAILDGDLSAWDEPLASGDPQPQPPPTRPLAVRSWPQHLLASIDETQAAAESPTTVVTDARPYERFCGQIDSPLDPRRGHIPGARWLAAREQLTDGRLLKTDRQKLKTLFADIGIIPGTPFIAACGSGVTACHNLLVAEQLGIDGGRLYVGSWSQYAADPDRPVSTSP